MKRILFLLLILGAFICVVSAQTETLTNDDIVLMTKSGLSQTLIARKIEDSKGNYETTTKALIELKKAGVADEVIALLLENKSAVQKANSTAENKHYKDDTNAHVVLEPKEALRSAKTIAIEKSSINPSRQALEKELLKRKDWQRLNLNIVRYKTDADLYVEIGFVPLSIITHRYVFRIYDRKSGTVLAAGETTSWGSLAENLARHISKELIKVL